MRFPVVLHTDDGVRFGVTAPALGPVASCGVEAVSFAVIAVSVVRDAAAHQRFVARPNLALFGRCLGEHCGSARSARAR